MEGRVYLPDVDPDSMADIWAPFNATLPPVESVLSLVPADEQQASSSATDDDLAISEIHVDVGSQSTESVSLWRDASPSAPGGVAFGFSITFSDGRVMKCLVDGGEASAQMWVQALGGRLPPDNARNLPPPSLFPLPPPSLSAVRPSISSRAPLSYSSGAFAPHPSFFEPSMFSSSTPSFSSFPPPPRHVRRGDESHNPLDDSALSLLDAIRESKGDGGAGGGRSAPASEERAAATRRREEEESSSAAATTRRKEEEEEESSAAAAAAFLSSFHTNDFYSSAAAPNFSSSRGAGTASAASQHLPSQSVTLDVPLDFLPRLASSALTAAATAADLERAEESLSHAQSRTDAVLREVQSERDKAYRHEALEQALRRENAALKEELRMALAAVKAANSARLQAEADSERQLREYRRGDEERLAAWERKAKAQMQAEREERERTQERAERALKNKHERDLAERVALVQSEAAAELAVALAEAASEKAEELKAATRAVTDRAEGKVKRLTEAAEAARRQTGSDFRQLADLHKKHVEQLEQALVEEQKRGKALSAQVTALTVERASAAAELAHRMEGEVRLKVAALAEVSTLKAAIESAKRERAELSGRESSAVATAKRIGDRARVAEAGVVGVKGRLAEAEAEIAALRREVAALRVEERGAKGMVELLRRENAMLVVERGTCREDLRKATEALNEVDKHIYGGKKKELTSAAAGATSKRGGSSSSSMTQAFFARGGGSHAVAKENAPANQRGKVTPAKTRPFLPPGSVYS